MDDDTDREPLSVEALHAVLTAALERQRGQRRAALDAMTARLLARELERDGYCLARIPSTA